MRAALGILLQRGQEGTITPWRCLSQELEPSLSGTVIPANADASDGPSQSRDSHSSTPHHVPEAFFMLWPPPWVTPPLGLMRHGVLETRLSS